MKKAIIVMLVLALALGLCASAMATSEPEVNPTSRSVVITTTIDHSYTITIPEETALTFNTVTSQPFGNIGLATARLEPGHQVTFSIGSGPYMLTHTDDSTKTIAYTVMDGTNTFTSASFTTANALKTLTLLVTQTAWNGAIAGDYTGSLTFSVAYEAVPTTP